MEKTAAQMYAIIFTIYVARKKGDCPLSNRPSLYVSKLYLLKIVFYSSYINQFSEDYHVSHQEIVRLFCLYFLL